MLTGSCRAIFGSLADDPKCEAHNDSPPASPTQNTRRNAKRPSDASWCWRQALSSCWLQIAMARGENSIGCTRAVRFVQFVLGPFFGLKSQLGLPEGCKRWAKLVIEEAETVNACGRHHVHEKIKPRWSLWGSSAEFSWLLHPDCATRLDHKVVVVLILCKIWFQKLSLICWRMSGYQRDDNHHWPKHFTSNRFRRKRQRQYGQRRCSGFSQSKYGLEGDLAGW